MKVHLIKRQSVLLFVEQHAKSKPSFDDWLVKIKYAQWFIPSDIKMTFAKADFLGKGTRRVVFDLGGNHYRLICKYYFGKKQVHLFVCWIGTHADYTKICRENKQYTIHQF
jgi:mRNA interferase HigB